MRAIDTNVLIRLLVRDDEKQALAAEKFIAKGAWVSLLALAESMWVLSSIYECTPKQIADLVAMLLEHDRLVLQDAEAVALALREFVDNPRLGFSDCLMLGLAHKANHLPLGTMDKQLAKRPGAMLVS